MNIQKHSAFARNVAKELLPAAPPATPGSDGKLSKRQQTARSTTKTSSGTPTTPQKSPNLNRGEKADDNGSDAILSGNATPNVTK